MVEDTDTATDCSPELMQIIEKPAPYIFFTPLALKYIHKRTHESVRARYTAMGERYNMSFKMLKSDSKLVKTLLYSYGFIQCSSKNPSCNLFWTNTHVAPHTLRAMKSWQRMNHFPRSYMITKKDMLYESIDRATVQYGEWFDFIPEFFCTPLTESKRAQLMEQLNQTQTPFIVKPACSSRGIGISFIQTPDEVDKLDNNSKLLISRYIDRPYLINGLKCDLRIYVLVTSFYPLIAYIYSDGLARFAVHQYDESNRRNYADVNAHLTNYSLNKNSEDFIKNKDCASENVGHKWTLGALLRLLEQQGHDVELLMIRIEDIVIKTLLSIQGSVAASCRKLNLHPKCCFELFGFDILLDEDLKPWLLEVNLSPSLACDAPLDSVMKTNLLCDTLNIAEITLVRQENTLNIATNDDNESIETDDSPTSLTSDLDARIGLDDGQQKPISPVMSAYASSILGSILPIKRRIVVGRMNKLKKAQLNHKPTLSAENMNSQYLSRAKCHFNKLESESQRKGHFIRVFPRQMTWDMYSMVLEDVGQEKWDEDLHRRMMEGKEKPYVTMHDIRTAHAQLINASNFPKRKDLDPVVKDVILKEAFANAVRYKKRMYSADIKPYPAVLPRVRSPARRRTRSQVIAEELRRAKQVALQEEQIPKDKLHTDEPIPPEISTSDISKLYKANSDFIALTEINMNINDVPPLL
ncbi:tubulin-tyrosine ligase family domain-containing protein [Ditylenchus destructor]|uniref:Tubulin--tyrosine ligase-like protein 5 n=1 Tax=Ditylenchus destructor TaxID=166010 RepID=A0AAD4NDK6_9BILA|nr:tubulin-tyrosine ligase family domain-containing protein [Ditylenchus destructor]